MKTWKALKAADEGKKIRRKWWSEGIYCFKSDWTRFDTPALIKHYCHGTFDRTFEISSMEDLDWDDVFADDWEIYEEEEVSKK